MFEMDVSYLPWRSTSDMMWKCLAHCRKGALSSTALFTVDAENRWGSRRFCNTTQIQSIQTQYCVHSSSINAQNIVCVQQIHHATQNSVHIKHNQAPYNIVGKIQHTEKLSLGLTQLICCFSDLSRAHFKRSRGIKN